jgi:hypothetical protein
MKWMRAGFAPVLTLALAENQIPFLPVSGKYKMKKRLRKTVVILITIITLISVSGFTGVTFALWPTFWPTHKLSVSPQAMEFLKGMRIRSKFAPDTEAGYPGAPKEDIRLDADARLNALLDTLLTDLPQHQEKAFVMAQFKKSLKQFEKFDSDEKDRLLLYLEDIMDEVGTQDSGELLNVWRYGFPYGWVSLLKSVKMKGS